MTTTTTTTNLYAASKQWAERPADQRFESLDEMFDACKHYADAAQTARVLMNQLRVQTNDAQTDLLLTGPAGNPATLTHWSFGQLCNRVAAPSDYLRKLPAPIAAECLTHGLQARGDDGNRANALFHSNGNFVCRAFTSDDYARIWNYELIGRLRDVMGDGWRVPPARPAFINQPGARPATEADVLARKTTGGGLAINVGDMIAPAGLYASDHDCFIFMVNEEQRIEDGSDGGLSRGFFISNSEVGASALKVTKFLYRHVCGNHIVWDAKDVQELRIVHRGNNDHRYGYKLRTELRQYANESAATDQARVTTAKGYILGATKEDVIDKLFGMKTLPKRTLETAYDHACQEADIRTTVSPRSVWGMVQGITHLSQETAYADERVALDRAAGKILSVAF